MAKRPIVSFSDLCELYALSDASEVQDWLRGNGILFFLDANDQPCTTANELDAALTRGKRTGPDIIDHEDLLMTRAAPFGDDRCCPFSCWSYVALAGYGASSPKPCLVVFRA